MQAPFGRWLPAVDRTSDVMIRTSAFVARTAVAGARTATAAATAVARAPVPRRPILVATGLTVAAAVAGGQLATGATAAPGPEPSTAAAADVPPAGGIGGGAASSADKPAARPVPPVEKLIPHGTQGQQSRIPLTREQTDNARAIVATAKKLGLPERAAVIGVATSLQESKLENLGHLGAANDHDSLGLFQQRPSTGWGSPHQVTDPEYAATAFYAGLRNIPDWQRLPLTQAAQAVQVSAYPFAYAQWEQQAAEIVQDVWVD